MKNNLFIAILLLNIVSCNNNKKGIKKFELECPKIKPQSSFEFFNTFSIKIPSNWITEILDPVHESEILTVIIKSDTVSELSMKNKFIKFNSITIHQYKGKSHSINFLIKSTNKDYEYFILTVTNISVYDSNYELCQMSEILKTFEIK